MEVTISEEERRELRKFALDQATAFFREEDEEHATVLSQSEEFYMWLCGEHPNQERLIKKLAKPEKFTKKAEKILGVPEKITSETFQEEEPQKKGLRAMFGFKDKDEDNKTKDGKIKFLE